MGDLSEHFSASEFACHGRGHPQHRSHRVIVAGRLVTSLEALRALCGGPCRIISGHRCHMWNREVGGAPSSRHLVGDAADLEEGYATVAQAELAGFTGIGNKGEWAVHVDTRPRQARWTY